MHQPAYQGHSIRQAPHIATREGVNPRSLTPWVFNCTRTATSSLRFKLYSIDSQVSFISAVVLQLYKSIEKKSLNPFKKIFLKHLLPVANRRRPRCWVVHPPINRVKQRRTTTELGMIIPLTHWKQNRPASLIECIPHDWVACLRGYTVVITVVILEIINTPTCVRFCVGGLMP